MLVLLAFSLDSLELFISKLEETGATISFTLYDLQRKKYIFAYNSKKYLPPASTMKVITTFAIQKAFRSNFTLQTYIFKHGSNLFVYAGADPTLTDDDLLSIASALKNMGITKVETLFYSDDIFTKDRYPPGWTWKDLERIYAPAISPLVLDEGIIYIYYKDSLKHNLSFLYSKAMYDSLTHRKVHVESDTLVVIYGDYYRVKGRWSLALPQKHPEEIFIWSFRNALHRNGIEVSHVGGYRALPEGVNLIYKYPSPPIDAILRKMNEESSNFIAEMLLRFLGAYMYGIGSWENGIKAVKKILADNGIDTNFVMMDGSGLSRYNLVSGEQFIQLYASAYRDPFFFNRFVQVLARPGKGTLKHRFKEFEGKLFAKTGTLKKVSTLSGIFLNRFAFHFTALGFSESMKSFRKKQDTFLSYVFSKLENSLVSVKINDDAKKSRYKH